MNMPESIRGWKRSAGLWVCLTCACLSGCAMQTAMSHKPRKPSQEKFSCGEKIPKSKLTPEQFQAASQLSQPLNSAGGQSSDGQVEWMPHDAAGHQH